VTEAFMEWASNNPIAMLVILAAGYCTLSIAFHNKKG
jgi:hypothetical protein